MSDPKDRAMIEHLDNAVKLLQKDNKRLRDEKEALARALERLSESFMRLKGRR